MIDFSKYNLWFEEYCKEYNKTFKSQKEADNFYSDSNILKQLQYIYDKGVVRVWHDYILDSDTPEWPLLN